MDGILFLQNICPYLNKNFNLNKMEIIKIERTVLSFKTIPIILVILRKTIIFAHSDA